LPKKDGEATTRPIQIRDDEHMALHDRVARFITARPIVRQGDPIGLELKELMPCMLYQANFEIEINNIRKTNVND
jgi:hypothetical protein